MIFREVGDSVEEKGGVALHKVDRQLLVEMAGCHRLLLSSLSGEGSCQLLYLLDSSLMPASQSLHCQRKEHNTLSLESSPNPTPGHLSVICISQGMACSGGSCIYQLLLQRVHNSHIPCSVLPTGPVGKEDICWPGIGTRKQSSTFLGRG